MEFMDTVPNEEETKQENSLEIGMIRYKNGDVNFELKNVTVRDLEGLRAFIFDVMEDFE